jgi:cytoskeletal protein CcmA (bactofilin family)
MWGRRKKRRLTKVDSLIGQNTEVFGDIHFTGGLHCDGSIRGNVIAEDDQDAILTLSDRGSIAGEVRVPYVILNGVVTGNVHATEHIELASSARVEGDVYYNLIEMAMGAEVNGKLMHQAEEARMPLALGHEEPLPAEGSGG